MVFLTLRMAFQNLQDKEFVHNKYPVYISQLYLQW